MENIENGTNLVKKDDLSSQDESSQDDSHVRLNEISSLERYKYKE